MPRYIEFPEQNLVIAKDQPQYHPLPAYRAPIDPSGTVAFKLKFSFRERLQLLFTGELWHEVLTFNGPLQPQRISLEKPEYITALKNLREP